MDKYFEFENLVWLIVGLAAGYYVVKHFYVTNGQVV